MRLEKWGGGCYPHGIDTIAQFSRLVLLMVNEGVTDVVTTIEREVVLSRSYNNSTQYNKVGKKRWKLVEHSEGRWFESNPRYQ